MAANRPEVARFFSSLHERLFKPRGYTKVRHTFQKEETGYAVALQFQGSDWNSSGTPWVFYLNAGIRFPDLPRREPDRDFPNIHCWTRVRSSLTQWAEHQYEVPAEDQDLLIGLIAAIVQDCEQYFAEAHPMLHERYAEKEISQIGYLDERLLK